jgi:hypothetical protein
MVALEADEFGDGDSGHGGAGSGEQGAGSAAEFIVTGGVISDNGRWRAVRQAAGE